VVGRAAQASLQLIIFLSDRRLSSGHSGALKHDGRRRKNEPAAKTTSNEELNSYSIHLSATAVPALRAGRPGLVSGGNRASGTVPGFAGEGHGGSGPARMGLNGSVYE